jgi:hypothetical protein
LLCSGRKFNGYPAVEIPLTQKLGSPIIVTNESKCLSKNLPPVLIIGLNAVYGVTAAIWFKVVMKLRL